MVNTNQKPIRDKQKLKKGKNPNISLNKFIKSQRRNKKKK